jgi:D-glycerate 3-kinase
VADWIAPLLQRERLPESYRETIDHVLRPLARNIAEQTEQSNEMLVTGLCGAQGSGKSTAVAALQEILEGQGLSTAVLSIDDFYLPRAARMLLSREVHPLLITRGVPGTHDVELLQAVIASLATAGATLLPRFDKATDDRLPHAQWTSFDGPARVVILEGWCVGARAQSTADLATPVNSLEREEDGDGRWRNYVNTKLAHEYRSLFGLLAPLILLRAPSFEVVKAWRTEQEHKLRARLQREGADASRVMSDGQVARFIAHYERITRHILDEMPQRASHVVQLDAQRHATL